MPGFPRYGLWLYWVKSLRPRAQAGLSYPGPHAFTHAELHQQLQPGNGHWSLKVQHSLQLTGAQKPCKVRVCAELGPFGGSCSWGHMQTSPNLAELTLIMCSVAPLTPLLLTFINHCTGTLKVLCNVSDKDQKAV